MVTEEVGSLTLLHSEWPKLKMVGLTLLHSKWPKLHRVLAILGAKGLRSTISWAQHIKDGCKPSPLTAFEVIFPNRYPFTASKAGNHVVLMMGFTEFRAGIRTKHVRK